MEEKADFAVDLTVISWVFIVESRLVFPPTVLESQCSNYTSFRSSKISTSNSLPSSISSLLLSPPHWLPFFLPLSSRHCFQFLECSSFFWEEVHLICVPNLLCFKLSLGQFFPILYITNSIVFVPIFLLDSFLWMKDLSLNFSDNTCTQTHTLNFIDIKKNQPINKQKSKSVLVHMVATSQKCLFKCN